VRLAILGRSALAAIGLRGLTVVGGHHSAGFDGRSWQHLSQAQVAALEGGIKAELLLFEHLCHRITFQYFEAIGLHKRLGNHCL
jgi:hypothetical protein